MAGVQFIEHQGRRVLLLDFTEVDDPGESLRLMAEARSVVAAQPRRKELLVIVDVKRMTVNEGVLAAFRELAAHNAPWVLASAVCHADRLGRVMTRANGVMTGRTFTMFDDRQKALDWIVTQGAAAAAPKPGTRTG